MYGTYAHFGTMANREVSSTGKTCLLYMGTSDKLNPTVKYITSWEDAERQFGITKDSTKILYEACYTCLDLLHIPFYAVTSFSTGEGKEEFINNVVDFVNNSKFDAYILCAVRWTLNEVQRIWPEFSEKITKPVLYIADFSNLQSWVSENNRPNVEKIIEAKNSLLCDAQHEVTFGLFQSPGSARPIALSALRAGLLAINPARVAGNIPFEATEIYASYRSVVRKDICNIHQIDAHTLAENGINTGVLTRGSYRTWGDLCTDSVTFENVPVVKSTIINHFLNEYKDATNLTLCDRGTIIRNTNAYLDSLVVQGFICSGSLSWFETEEGSGVWHFAVSPITPKPIKSLTASIKHKGIEIII